MTEQSSSDREDLHELSVEDDFAGAEGAARADTPDNSQQGAASSGQPSEAMPGYGSDSGFDAGDASAGGAPPAPDPQPNSEPQSQSAGTGSVGGPVDGSGGEAGGGVPDAANSEYSEDSDESI